MLPQRIHKIAIEGYKSISRAELNLRPLTLLIGPNGAGKSNLLSLFRMLRQLALEDLQLFVGRSGGADRLLYRGAKHTRHIKIGVDLETSTGPARYQLELEYAAGDRLFIASEVVDHDTSAAPQQRDAAASDGGGRESRLAGEAVRGVGAGWNIFQFLDAIRCYHFHDTTAEAKIRQNCDVDDNRVLHPDGRNLAAVLYKLQTTAPHALRLITRTIRQIAPFFHSFRLQPSAQNERVIALRWREKGAEEDFDCAQLSDGTLRFIALATLLLQPKEAMPGLILIDEPELGLHPQALSLLGSMIHRAAAGRQVLIATQSADLIDYFDPENIVVVERTEATTEFHRLSAERLADWLEEYTLGQLWRKNVLGGRPLPWLG